MDSSVNTAEPVDPPQSKSKGIHIKDALSILSSRSKGGGENLASNSKSITKEMKEMGQTIDIIDQMEFAKPDTLHCECARSTPLEDMEQVSKVDDEKHDSMRQERKRRGKEIQTTLQSLNVSELLGTVFAAQEERVATYKLYDQGLSTILSSGNMTTYPVLCAKVTASFSVLSDTINAVCSLLTDEHKRNDISEVVSHLQKYEGEKLNLTAAIHLEKLRLRNEDIGLCFGGSKESSTQLLKEGIQSLERKIASNIDSINDIIDELRCIAAEEDEE